MLCGPAPHCAPPQSTSVSVPSCTPLKQLMQVRLTNEPIASRPEKQDPDVQSESVAHEPPSGQDSHPPPPQSTPVSSPSCWPFVQETHIDEGP